MQLLTKARQFIIGISLNYSILVFIALIGVIVPCWYFNFQDTITSLILGIIAAALAETDENFIRRLKAQSLALACFAIATFSIEVLFDTPWLFAIGLFCSTIIFIMLGAIGARYTKIAFGSLLIAIYTMIGAHASDNLWFQPLLLLTGALWYFFLSIIWLLAAPKQPVQNKLAAIFQQLSIYLNVKKALFHPSDTLVPQAYRIRESHQNAQTVNALNDSKAVFLSRSNRGQIDGTSERFLKIYFLAQDIHERVSSSHYRYQELSKILKHSDIMFRFKYLIEQQSIACKEIAQSIRLGVQYEHSKQSEIAIKELSDSLDYLKQQNQTNYRMVIPQLEYLFNNLTTVEKQLTNVNNPDIKEFNQVNTLTEGENLRDSALQDNEAHNIKEMWLKVKTHLTPSSLLFRHAIRLSIALTAGYGVIQALDLDRGYWILLTTLFVCQPNYSATKQKLVSRIVGTAVGLVVGVGLLFLFPSNTSQMVFILISGTAFFIFRENNYSYATAFITVLVLFCFHQLGEGYAVILPRFTDTLIGCLLAVAAVTFILPDWHSRRIHTVMANSLQANRNYLSQIVAQYRVGKKDNLQYRIARREAHNQSALLSSAITNMLVEPEQHQTTVDTCFRFLTLNHALLSYVSALGSHRTRLDDAETHQLILQAHRNIDGNLTELFKRLSLKPGKEGSDSQPATADKIFDSNTNTSNTFDAQIYDPQELDKRLAKWRANDDGRPVSMVLQQLHLIHCLLPELSVLTDNLTESLKASDKPE